MKDNQFKTKTYVDNPPVKDNITKTSFQMRFSKSNFVFIGKWIIAFVLVVVLGSQALNGFISSKFTKDSTTEMITHEYKKLVGYESPNGHFDFIKSFDDLSYLRGKTLILKDNPIIDNDFISLIKTYYNDYGVSYYNLTFDFTYYLNGSIDRSYSRFGIFSGVNVNGCRVSNEGNRYNYFISFNDNSLKNYYKGDAKVVINNYAGFIDTNFYPDLISSFLNTFWYIEGYVEELIPIYETTTYTYEVKDNNYNWDLKLKQLSSFKPLFKFNQSFINEEYLKYNNLISYEFIDTSAGRELLVQRYKNDERLKPLFDNNYLIIGGKTESGLFKDKSKFYSFLTFNGNLDYDIQGVSTAYNWVLDNYVTDFNIDSYLKESKYKIELKDILEIFKFPIQIVNNLVYDFGVLIGFITWW